MINVKRDAPLPEQFNGGRQHRESFQSQEVKLYKTSSLGPFHGKLGDRHFGPGVSVKWYQVGQGPITNNNPRRMGGSMSIQSLQFFCYLNEPGDRLVLVNFLTQLRFPINRLLEVSPVPRDCWAQVCKFGPLGDTAFVARGQHPVAPREAVMSQR